MEDPDTKSNNTNTVLKQTKRTKTRTNQTLGMRQCVHRGPAYPAECFLSGGDLILKKK